MAERTHDLFEACHHKPSFHRSWWMHWWDSDESKGSSWKWPHCAIGLCAVAGLWRPVIVVIGGPSLTSTAVNMQSFFATEKLFEEEEEEEVTSTTFKHHLLDCQSLQQQKWMTQNETSLVMLTCSAVLCCQIGQWMPKTVSNPGLPEMLEPGARHKSWASSQR